jgi:Amt family ammonium transporter
MGIVFVFVFTVSYVTFGAIKAIFGLRVSDEEELEGLDIAEHGMYGYPEQFVAPGTETELAGLLTDR